MSTAKDHLHTSMVLILYSISQYDLGDWCSKLTDIELTSKNGNSLRITYNGGSYVNFKEIKQRN